MEEESGLNQVDPKVLAILANPLHPDRPPLKQVGSFLICTLTGTGFPVINGVPHLLPEDGIPAEEISRILKENGKQ